MKLCQEKEKAIVLVTKILKDYLWSDKKVHFHLRQKRSDSKQDGGTEKTESEKNSKYIFIR